MYLAHSIFFHKTRRRFLYRQQAILQRLQLLFHGKRIQFTIARRIEIRSSEIGLKLIENADKKYEIERKTEKEDLST